MSEAKITKGPWRYMPYKGSTFYIHGDYSPSPRVCEIHYTSGAHSYHEADARLIAAAPDLLAALQAMVAKYGFDHTLGHPVSTARDAITKATEGSAQ